MVGDGGKACDQLTGDARRELVNGLREQVPQFEGDSCEEAIEGLADNIGENAADTLREADVTAIKIDGDRASARPEGGTADAELVKTGDGWRIDEGLY